MIKFRRNMQTGREQGADASLHSPWGLARMICCVALTAQSFSLITGREPVTSLNGLWRFHSGDNPAWADPQFDDSH